MPFDHEMIVTWPAGAHDTGLANRDHEVGKLRHLAGVAVEHLVLEEDHRIGIADRGLEQALVVGGRERRDDLEARNVRVPGRVVLAVLGGNARSRAVRTAEHDRAAHLAAGHVERLGGGVDDLVDRLHGEVEGHELDDRLQPGHRGTNADTGKAVLGDRRVDHAPGAKFLEQSLRDLVGALIFGDLLTHHEDVRIAAHLFGHGVAQRFADGLGDHLGAGRHFRIGLGDRLRCRRSLGRWCLGLCSGGRSGFRRLLLLGWRRRFRKISRALAVGENRRNRRVDGNVGGALGDQDLAECALIGRLDLHGGLVGLDLGDYVAGLDRLALFFQPFGEVALFHRGRQRGHQHLNWHIDSKRKLARA
ncbi:hypothetical protein ACVWYH_008739 [Bradyrhizobium sp. GM24.11]